MPSSCAESLKGWRQDGCEKHGENEAIDFNGWTDGDGSKRIKNHHEERQCRRRNLAHTKLIPYMEAHSVSRKEEEGATIGKAKPEDSADNTFIHLCAEWRIRTLFIFFYSK